MNFEIESPPPSTEAIAAEYSDLQSQLKAVKLRDTIITFVLIVIVSIILGALVYFYTENIRNALITVTVIPLLGAIMMSTGVVANAGFRSAAHRIITLNHQIIALENISSEDSEDVERLGKKYDTVSEYVSSVEKMGRKIVNGELGMFWEWDASTMAKTARGRDYIEKAKSSVDAGEDQDEPQFDI